MRKFRFGHSVVTAVTSRDTWVETAKRTAANGYAVLTVTDHLGRTSGVWASLVAAHEAAPSLRVGTLVINNDLWNPAVLAREAITTDVLTDGALELGVGAGWDQPDYRASGIRRDAPGVRIDRLTESLTILGQAFAGERVAFAGKHYVLEADAPWPTPRQQPIPLVLGGGGRRVLRLAARHATTVSIHRNLEEGTGGASWGAGTGMSHADQVSQRVAWVREAAGARFADLELHALVLKVVVTDDRAAAAAEIARPAGLAPDDVLASPHFLVGTIDQMVEDLLDRRERWGFSYLTIVQAADALAFAPVIARLAGK